MGKWTPDYTDDVLHSKIKNLVSGAIKRAALEKAEPVITYEDFVHDLETGDSFTTSLVEVLVKELAERRTRPNNNDERRLIADRSAKSLRMLAAPNRIYRDHSFGRFVTRRRSGNLSDYLSAPPLEMDMEEDEDIFERMLDNGTTIEGARLNSDLYDAIGNNSHSSRAIPSPSPPAEEVTSPVPQPPSHTYFRSGPWSMATSSSGSTVLTRQPSLRRPARSRTVDFNEFTHRRRSSTRDNQGSRGEPGDAPDNWEPLRHSHPTRRFFPFIRARRFDHPEAWSSDLPPFPDSENPAHYGAEPSNAPWFSLTPPIHRDTTTMEEVLADTELSDERAHTAPAPRLRRGGLRAPESILSRHASPVPGPIPGFIHNAPEPAYDRDHGAVTESAPEDSHPHSELTGYPTPSSTEHEFFA